MVLPNPATTEITIKTKEVINLVTITNLQGQELLTSHESEIDISSLSAGYYMVKIIQNNKVTIKQIIKL